MASLNDVPAGPLIFFDGVCNLCNAAVQWVIERDRRGVFRFGVLQSEAGRAALGAATTPTDLPDSIVLIDGARVHIRSDAALRIARELGFPWSLAVIALAVPRPLRDAVYSWVARNRYRWFGRRESCMVPTPELAARFVDAGEFAAPASDTETAADDPAPASAATPTTGAVQKEALVTTRASGTFEVKMTPEAMNDKAEGAVLGRMSLEKSFHGDLEATGKGTMLTAGTSVKGSAGYVAIERVSGTLHGRRGTFALQHTGTMTRGAPELAITVVPDSGTGELAGLAGKLAITVADEKHSYDLEYTLSVP
jgi:predicted DCC family thiol-disulfide oxidoreductase YuxK